MTHMHPMTGLRLTSVIFGVSIVGLVLALFVGAAGLNPLALKARETVLMVPSLLAVAGLLVAWRSELADGVLTVGAILFIVALNWAFSGGLPRGWAFETLVGLASLLVICAIMDKTHNTTTPHGRMSPNG